MLAVPTTISECLERNLVPAEDVPRLMDTCHTSKVIVGSALRQVRQMHHYIRESTLKDIIARDFRQHFSTVISLSTHFIPDEGTFFAEMPDKRYSDIIQGFALPMPQGRMDWTVLTMFQETERHRYRGMQYAVHFDYMFNDEYREFVDYREPVFCGWFNNA